MNMLSFYLPINGVTTSGVHPPFTWQSGSDPVVLIPIGRESVSVIVQAVDDQIVERLHETLDIKIVSATLWGNKNVHYAFAKYEPEKEDPFNPNYEPNYEPPPGSLLYFKIEDNDTLDLQKVVFQGILPGFKSDPDSLGNSIIWDNTNSNVSHWWKGKLLDKNPSVGFVPAAYSSQNQLQAKAFWANTQIDLDIINDLYVYFEVDINGVRQSNTVQLVNSGGTLNMGASLAELAQTFEALQQVKKAEYKPSFTLTWKFYVGGDEKHRNAGESKSCLYVTYDDPQTGNLYHSVIDIGCRAADGETTEQGVFNKIWAKFESSNNSSIDIYRVVIENGVVNPAKATVKDSQGNIIEQGNELYYYGIAATPPSGWTPDYPVPSNPINQYSVARHITSVAGSQKILQHRDGICDDWGGFFLDIVQAQGNTNAKIAWVRANDLRPFWVSLMAVNAGLGKHHNQSPLERSWEGHVIVFYNNTHYDTSYGINYGDTTNCVSTFIGNLEAVFDRNLNAWRYTKLSSDVVFTYFI